MKMQTLFVHTHTCVTLMCVCANNKTFNIYFIRILVGILCIINLQAKLQQFSRSKKTQIEIKIRAKNFKMKADNSFCFI